MLLRVTISNFLSFYDEVTFDMFPSHQRKGFMNHVYIQEKIPVLKMGAIYGANNTGKSNFIKALFFVRNVVTKFDFLNKGSFEDIRYKLVEDRSKPIKIEVEFSYKDIYYLYSLKLDTEIQESLSLSGLGEKDDVVVFKRDGAVIASEGITMQDLATDLLKKNPYTSVIALNNTFPVISSEHVTNALLWFSNNLQVININSSVKDLIKMMNQNGSLLEFSDKMVKLFDISESLSIRQMDLEQWLETDRGKAFRTCRTFQMVTVR